MSKAISSLTQPVSNVATASVAPPSPLKKQPVDELQRVPHRSGLRDFLPKRLQNKVYDAAFVAAAVRDPSETK